MFQLQHPTGLISYLRHELLMKFSGVVAPLLLVAAVMLSSLATNSWAEDNNIDTNQLCPDSPNCVSSYVDKEDPHYIAPIDITDNADAWVQLRGVIEAQARTKITEEHADFLYVEFRSLIFRFTDDVGFWLDDANKLIHIRSASRVGYSDLGANRKRMENIRALLLK